MVAAASRSIAYSELWAVDGGEVGDELCNFSGSNTKTYDSS